MRGTGEHLESTAWIYIHRAGMNWDGDRSKRMPDGKTKKAEYPALEYTTYCSATD